jgi:diguanylate cyclase (GGDEF)-like protein/PAS domain S-box-containing protein
LAQKVLIIDDSLSIHALVRARLKSEPIELLHAESGRAGLDIARATLPDLILLDVDMPHPDGFEVCRLLKSDSLTREIAVIFLTGASSTDQKLTGLELGAVDYIVKPFDPAELRARVRSSLRNQELLASLQESEERFRFLAENSSDMITRHNPAGEFLYVSRACRLVLGYEPKDLLGCPMQQIIHPEDLEAFAAILSGRPGDAAVTATFRACRKDGRIVWLESTARAVPLKDADALGGGAVGGGGAGFEVHLSSRDVTSRKQAETLEHGRAAVLQMIAESRPLSEILRHLVRMVEHEYPAAHASAALLAEGRMEHTAPTLPAAFKTVLDTRMLGIATAIAASLTTANDRSAVVCHNIDTDPHWVALHSAAAEHQLHTCWLTLLRSTGGEVLGMFAIYHRDRIQPDRQACALLETIGKLITVATEHQTLTYQLAYRAQHDALTGLPNRLLFEDRLAQAIAHAQRGEHMMALCCMDLDRFKSINDTLGHHAGDLLLQKYARRVEDVLRATDTLARMGGDEFALILPEVADRESALIVVQRVLDVFKAPFDVAGRELFITGSIGIAFYPRDATDAGSLQKNADLALYRAKATGRNRFQCFAQDMLTATAERLSLENDLRRAVKGGELVLYYQPQFDDNRQLIGLESLVRWEHPTLGLMPPVRFVALAEETGLILQIGDWVLGETCRQAKAWQRAGHTPVRVSVNVSALQVAQSNFAETVAAALKQYDLAPQWLELEITESVLMKNARETAAKLEQISELGVGLALDDFGTGYSSLAYLQQLPIDTLKIDRSFVRQIDCATPAPSSMAVIRAIISLGSSLGMHVIAEGVETEPQLDQLSSAGCRRIQGYLLGKPLPPGEVERFFQKTLKPAA